MNGALPYINNNFISLNKTVTHYFILYVLYLKLVNVFSFLDDLVSSLSCFVLHIILFCLVHLFTNYYYVYLKVAYLIGK